MEQKADLVAEVFHRVASKYDIMNGTARICIRQVNSVAHRFAHCRYNVVGNTPIMENVSKCFSFGVHIQDVLT